MKALKKIMDRVRSDIKNTNTRILTYRQAARLKLAETSGQFSVDNVVVIVITVAVAAIVLGLIISFLQTDLAPAVKEKILDFLN